MRWVSRVLLLLILAVAAYWLWTTFFPPPEKVIRKRISQLQKIASFDSGEPPAAKLFNARKFSNFFTPDVKIIVDLPGQSGMLQGRDELFTRDVAARNTLRGLDVKALDVNVRLAPGGESASVGLTATARITGEPDFMVQEMELAMDKAGGAWLISQVKTVRTLK